MIIIISSVAAFLIVMILMKLHKRREMKKLEKAHEKNMKELKLFYLQKWEAEKARIDREYENKYGHPEPSESEYAVNPLHFLDREGFK